MTGAIVGARRPGQLDQWIGAGGIELSGDLLRAITDAIAETGAGTGHAHATAAIEGLDAGRDDGRAP